MDSKIDLDTFAADLATFAEEYWQVFTEWAAERDYTISDCEEDIKQIRHKAGFAD